MKRLLSLVLFFLLQLPIAASAQSPNILFVYIDDMGWKDVGYMGSDFYETPTIDALASAGAVFTNAYSCAANCAPARASLMSGQYTPRHQIFNVGTQARGRAEHRRLLHVPGTDTLDPKIKTWAHQLQAAGYATASIGKWHLSKDPCEYGFDVNIGGSQAGSPPQGYYPPHRSVAGLEDAADDEYLTDRLSHEAIRFIEKNQERPWCVYLTHFAVHTPLDAKKELKPKYEQKPAGELHSHVAMATMIQAVDDGLQSIVATLDKLKLRENTIIVFTSDNGGYGPATDMAPLKGYKGTYYEGGIRVPMFVNWPKKIPAKQTITQPVTGVDIYPTICGFADAALPAKQSADGVSLVDLLISGKPLSTRALFWHFPAYLQSYSSDWLEQRDVLFRSRPCSIIRVGDWKLHQYFESGDFELYNLKSDIGEAKDLSDVETAKREELSRILTAWQQEIGAPTQLEANPDFDKAKEAEARNRKLRKQRKSE